MSLIRYHPVRGLFQKNKSDLISSFCFFPSLYGSRWQSGCMIKRPAAITTCPDYFGMSRICSGNTKPEMLVRKFLHANGFRYSLHKKKLQGKPDIVLPKYKTIIFINGCFWHGHANCKYFVVPKTRTKFWLNKIASNKANDEKAAKALRKDGWKVITVLECKLKPGKVEKTLSSLLKKI